MKKFYQSKTIIYNVITGLGIILAILGQYDIVADPEAVGKAVEINTMLAPLINIYLRSITNKGITA